MVAVFVRLRLTLLGNTFRRSVWQTIGFVIGVLYVLGIIAMVVLGMLGLGTADVDLAATLLTLGGAVAVLLWWVIPLFIFGVDATLDPRRFVLFPLSRPAMLAGLTAAGLVTLPGFATLVAGLGTSLAFWRHPVELGAALLGAVFGIALCVVGSRAWTTILAPLMESRRSREVLTVAALIPLALLSPAFMWLGDQMRGIEENPDAVREAAESIADIVAWTPFGAPWALPASALAGDWAKFVAQIAVTLLTLVVLLWVWDRGLVRSVLTPPTESTGKAKGLGWFGRLPATPTGTVAARTLTYWVRDPRYSGSVAAIPMALVGIFVMSRIVEAPILLLALGPIVGWLLGYTISADLATDNTAFVQHILTGVSGRADRWGRALPVLAIGGVLTVVITVVSVALADRWDDLPATLAVAVAILLVSIGVSSVASAQWIYPMAKPGDSPFKQPQGAAMVTMISQGITVGLLLLLSLPVLVPATIAVINGTALWGWVALAISVVLGTGVLFGGVRLGARIYERRAPEILQKIANFA